MVSDVNSDRPRSTMMPFFAAFFHFLTVKSVIAARIPYVKGLPDWQTSYTDSAFPELIPFIVVSVSLEAVQMSIGVLDAIMELWR